MALDEVFGETLEKLRRELDSMTLLQAFLAFGMLIVFLVLPHYFFTGRTDSHAIIAFAVSAIRKALPHRHCFRITHSFSVVPGIFTLSNLLNPV